MNILVVEDDAVQRSLLVRLLEREGYSVCWASTIEGAIRLLRTETVELVLLDIGLDGRVYGGLEVARHIARGVPIFVISGTNRDDVREAARVNALDGVHMWIDKPIEIRQLLMAVSHVVKGRGT